jgi:hypothetical protein
MPRTTAFLIAALSCTFQFTSAQYFERIYTGLNLGYVGSVDNTIDSGFIFCGNQDGGFLMKLDARGDTEWTKRDTGTMEYTAAVIQEASGNYIVIGSGPSQQYNSEAVIATYDLAGNLVSDFKIPPDNGWGTWGTTITRSPDRTSMHYCYYTDGFTADNYFMLDNMDKIGGDMTYVGLNSISIDNHGQYYAAANLAFDMDTLFNWHNNVLVLSSSNFPHQTFFYDTDISCAAITADGGVFLAGLYDSLGTKYLRLMKFDSAANLLWDSFIADTSFYAVSQVAQTADGGYVILCAGNAVNASNISLIKVDGGGLRIWQETFFGSGAASPRNFRILDDGFVILGNTNGDPYIIRTDSIGRTNTTAVSATPSMPDEVMVYPNPSDGNFNVSFSGDFLKEIHMTVYDLTGRMVYAARIDQPIRQLNLSFLAKGIYQYRFVAGSRQLKNGKLAIE